MDEMVYEALKSYFNVLEKVGYMSYVHMEKLLILMFYRDFVFGDYTGILTKEDYRLIERALNCLYGSTCLIPYPDYLKGGKLHLGRITEQVLRIKALENADVLKLTDNPPDGESDIIIVMDEGDIRESLK